MEFQKLNQFNNLEMGYISRISGGYISKNRHIFEKIKLNPLNKFILEKCIYGTPIFKLGNKGNRILVSSGVHGNELSSQIANLNLLNEFVEKELSHTVYFIPFVAPKASMLNERTFNERDLNRSAHIKNSLSSLIIQVIDDLKINFVGDFHTTAYNSNPGCEVIFSSKNPSPESFLIANYISNDVGSEVIAYDVAGSIYKGAIEDVSNLKGIPAITGEVVSPFASVGKGSVERSYAQMKSFLSYFGIWLLFY